MKERNRLFRLIMVILVLAVLEGIGYIAMWANSRSFDWVNTKNYFKVRAMLMGDTTPDQRARYLSQPYLSYIPDPGYAAHGVVQHNGAGYRGQKIPLIRSRKLRILCLGGSTTYGLGVPLPSQTYPARLSALLNRSIGQDSILRTRYGGAEVLNAGLEAGTSAEELEQYLLKYRYYRPDIVIVHSGVNDAEIMASADRDFQLDYTHYRRLQFHLEPLSQPARFFMHSYLFSYLTIRLFYANFYYSGVSGRQCYVRQRGQQFAHWSDIAADTIRQGRGHLYLPFYRNTQSLYAEVVRDSAILLVLPNILNEKDSFVNNSLLYRDLCAENLRISAKLASEAGGIVVPFAYDSIHDPHSWLDDCHLDTAGEMDKAMVLLPVVVHCALQRSRCSPNDK
ncbi:MAG: SGNH/GDSL hydrolase family protein [Bacteroidetes bacterium]|nr:SGNH/GDSL hydrolase family protein [Bacteroidota bacterium]